MTAFRTIWVLAVASNFLMLVVRTPQLLSIVKSAAYNHQMSIPGVILGAVVAFGVGMFPSATALVALLWNEKRPL